MSADYISVLWNSMVNVVGNIQDFFGRIFSFAQEITNIGQAIWMGLATIASAVWEIFTVHIPNAIKFFATQIFNLGNWIYNSLIYIWNTLSNIFATLWNTIVSWFVGLSTSLFNWWNGVVNTINSWWTNLVVRFREKIKHTIMANICIVMAWKSGERILSASSFSDIGYGVFGLFASPIVGSLVGSIVDAVIPSPGETVYPLIPSVPTMVHTPPSMTPVIVEEKPKPSFEIPSYYPITEKTVRILSFYDIEFIQPQAEGITEIYSSYEVSVSYIPGLVSTVDVRTEFEFTLSLILNVIASIATAYESVGVEEREGVSQIGSGYELILTSPTSKSVSIESDYYVSAPAGAEVIASIQAYVEVVYNLTATKYDGVTDTEAIMPTVTEKYDGMTEPENIYNVVGVKYDGKCDSDIVLS